MNSSSNRFVVLAFCVASLSCNDGTAPGPFEAGVRIISGGSADTIDARPIRALTVQVRGDAGVPAAGKVIRFRSLFGSNAFVLVSALTASNLSDFAAVTADDEGRASVLLGMGYRSGVAKIEISVPEIALLDTIEITVQPGAAARAEFSVRDTVVGVGESYTLTAQLRDRWGNERTEAAVIDNRTPTLCTFAGSTVTGSAMGRCLLVATYADMRDTARASVLPPGRLAVMSVFDGIKLISTNGGGQRSILASQHSSTAPAWAPDGSSLVIYEGDPGSSATLSVIDTNGVKLKTIGGGTAIAGGGPARFSPDGQWIYFSGRGTYDDPITIWRMHPDATALEAVLAPSQNFSFGAAWRPNVSPDNLTVTFDANGSIALLDVATRQATSLGVQGLAPSFSPDGQRIAFLGPSGNGLRVMNRNGTNIQTLSDAYFYEWQAPQWTSDGNWLLVQSGGLQFVNATTGVRLPLAGLAAYNQGALKPPLGR